MSHLHQCPNCLYLFVHRKFDREKAGLRCRRCNVQIIHGKELYIEEDKMFLCVSKGDERAIRPWDSTAQSWGELVDWEEIEKQYEWDGEKRARTC